MRTCRRSCEPDGMTARGTSRSWTTETTAGDDPICSAMASTMELVESDVRLRGVERALCA